MMKLAAERAARYAVGPLGLAALAVSATIALRPTPAEPEPVDEWSGYDMNAEAPEGEPPFRVRVGEVVVVGSPDAEEIAARIRALDFAHCGWRNTTCGPLRSLHETLYVHIRDGVVRRDGDYEATCLMAVVESTTYIGDADVMIPIDFGTPTASSP